MGDRTLGKRKEDEWSEEEESKACKEKGKIIPLYQEKRIQGGGIMKNKKN